MNDMVSIPRESFQQILKSIEHYCVNCCPLFNNACLHSECPLFAIEHVLIEYEIEVIDEPLCWYLINFTACDEIALIRTTNDNAESIADNYGEPYDLFVYGSYEDALDEMRRLVEMKG